jgi:hypothetical protein
MADVTKSFPNPFAKTEWSLGMALMDYFQIPLREVAKELLAIRTMNDEEAKHMLESLKRCLEIEGYNIVPLKDDRTQQPLATISNFPVVIQGSYSRVVAEDDGVIYEEPLPPDVSSCGYSVGNPHPAAPAV